MGLATLRRSVVVAPTLLRSVANPATAPPDGRALAQQPLSTQRLRFAPSVAIVRPAQTKEEPHDPPLRVPVVCPRLCPLPRRAPDQCAGEEVLAGCPRRAGDGGPAAA